MRNFDLPIYKNSLKTKEDVNLAVEQICHPLKDKFSKGNAHLHVGNTSAGHPDPIAEMEGFSRLLWGIVPLLAGGREYDGWEATFQGIKNGTNPSHEEYWGSIQDYDQRIVEVAVYGFALALIPEKIWEPLNEEEKSHFVSWISQINDCKVHDCNWLLFPVLVNLGLKAVEAPYDKEKIENNLDRINAFYIADGWYSDGVDAHCDYYTSFAIHYYCLFYAELMKSEDPERSKLYKERAGLFAQDFIYWFAKDGSALPYGRSLSYRFAQVSFWSAMVFAEVEVFSYGQMKGIILNNLRWWFKQPIFLADGTLSIGYAYPNQVMAENYNSPGSPYWGLKTFLILALKDDHPFWQAEETSLPQLKEVSVQHPAHLVLCRQEETNHVLAFNTGHRSTNDHTHTSAKYEKFVYSNYFGFSVPRAEWGLEQGAFDSTLALSEGDNIYRVKRKVEEYKIDDNVIYTKWKPWENVVVSTWLITGAPWHIRVHQITTQRKLDVADGGFALGKTEDDSLEVMKDNNAAIVNNSLGKSGVKSLYGNAKAILVNPNSNTNLIHSRTTIPTVTSKIDVGTSLLVSGFYGEPNGEKGRGMWQEAPYVEVKDNEIKIYASDKSTVVYRQRL
ncbi:hypothetical protein CR203_13880 [Salipaludibacillus neizhouensis]|uniref:DUF2264 domain-containing protein n=1 Tax=Salipaludibacillus neizhouensis TaxID=885475 RepID=A0A3A9K1D9_9BACI|nr:DUF2264 domain-containing protein [Salipaludibacillus neizhouensis]RKL66914.1 hypothetical protein CR203_13880 [Salipaludibacillus neizhouensis]